MNPWRLGKRYSLGRPKSANPGITSDLQQTAGIVNKWHENNPQRAGGVVYTNI